MPLESPEHNFIPALILPDIRYFSHTKMRQIKIDYIYEINATKLVENTSKYS